LNVTDSARSGCFLSVLAIISLVLCSHIYVHTDREFNILPGVSAYKPFDGLCSYLIRAYENTYVASKCEGNSMEFTSTDAATVFNRAISSSPQGSIVLIAEGNYTISSPINLHKAISLKGSGYFGTAGGTNMINNQNNTMLNVTAYFVRITDLTLVGTGDFRNSNDTGIKITNANNVEINNIIMLEHYNDLEFSGSVFYTNVQNVGWYSAENNLVYSDETSDISVRFINCIGFVQHAVNGFNLQGLDSIVFDSVEMSGNFSGTPLILNRQVGGATVIANSLFENSIQLHRAMWIKGSSTTPVSAVLVSNSYFGGGNTPLDEPAVQIDNGIDISFQGGLISGTGRGIKVENLNKFVISNVIFEVILAGISTDKNSDIGNLTISQNHYQTVGNYLLNVFETESIKGKILVEGNNVVGSLGFGFIPGSPIIAANNIGYNPQPAANIEAEDSPYTYINNDGYAELITISGGEISQIAIRGIDTNLSSGSFMLQPLDSVTITFEDEENPPTIVKIPQ
jgi:hypothetical protein